jgi:hypothetical protein
MLIFGFRSQVVLDMGVPLFTGCWSTGFEFGREGLDYGELFSTG